MQTRNLNPWVRYFLALITALLASVVFLGLVLGSLWLGALLLR
jgi:hypothetical protein